jgi:hypothetical protein
MAIPIQSQIYNPVTGVFGIGQMQIFGFGTSASSWTVPAGIGKVRVRLWGGGATAGGGGGFAIKTINDLSGVTSIAVQVGGTFGASSFGNYVSATGGTNTSGSYGGTGVGGDINYSGGNMVGGGAGSIFGNGGSSDMPGASGFYGANYGGNGLLGSGSSLAAATNYFSVGNSGMQSSFSIDFIGTGGGGVTTTGSGYNGGGGGLGGYPGGGGQTGVGAPGMVIVEW